MLNTSGQKSNFSFYCWCSWYVENLLIFHVFQWKNISIFIDRTSDNSKSSNPIVTIKLTEKDEIINDPNTGQPQQYFAETFFQMNTSTGEWKRIKKLRPINQLN